MQLCSRTRGSISFQASSIALIFTGILAGIFGTAASASASVDSSFADNGWLILPNSSTGVDAMVSFDGSTDRFLAVTQSREPIQISAFEADGNPVGTFANFGVLEVPFDLGFVVDLFRLPNNVFLLVGRNGAFAFGASGVALADFDNDGVVLFDRQITAATAHEGHLFAARSTSDPDTGEPFVEVEKRSLADGELVATFGTDGVARIRSFASNSNTSRFIRIDPAGRPVVFGHIAEDRQLTMARFTASGEADSSFGPDANGLTRDNSGIWRFVDDFEIIDGRLIGSGRSGGGIFEVLDDGSAFEGRVVNTQIGTCIPRDIVPLSGGGLLSVGYDESVSDGSDNQICILAIDDTFSIDHSFTSYSSGASGERPTFDYFGEDEDAMAALVLPSGRIVIGAARQAPIDMLWPSSGPGKILMLVGPAPDYEANDDGDTATPSPTPTPDSVPRNPESPDSGSSGSGAPSVWLLVMSTILLSRRSRASRPMTAKRSTVEAAISAFVILSLSGCATKTLTSKGGEEIKAKQLVSIDGFSYKARYCSGFIDEPALLHNHLTRSLSPEDYKRYKRLNRASSPTARATAAGIEAAGRERLATYASAADVNHTYVIYSDWVALQPIKGRQREYVFRDSINGRAIGIVPKLWHGPVDLRLVQDSSHSEYDTGTTVVAGGPLGLKQETYTVEKKVPAVALLFDVTDIANRNRGIWFDPIMQQLVVRVSEDFERDVIQANLDEGWGTKVKVSVAGVIDSCTPTSQIMNWGRFMEMQDIRMYRLSGHVKRIEVRRGITGGLAGALTSVMKGDGIEGPLIAEWDR